KYRTREHLTAVVTVITALAGIFYMQEIPAEHQTALDNAYSDTDGNGERADKFPADSARYYEEIDGFFQDRSEEHTSELQSRFDLVCRLLLDKKKTTKKSTERRS